MIWNNFFIKTVLITALFLVILTSPVFSYDTDNTHPLINKKAIQLSSNFLKVISNLGFTGIDSIVNEQQIYKWFEDGARDEDNPFVRSYNHFHDPTKSWDKAGLKSSTWGDSSILWAQDSNQQYIASDGTVYDINGTWSWPNAREYYYQALTSTDKTAREQNLAYTFKALGQVMHLLADSSVPEHTRDDIHVFPLFNDTSFQIGTWTYETWCKHNSTGLKTSATAIDYSITNNSLVSGLVPITNFWDTTPSLGYNLSPVGLAEYSNLNFLSKDTIFKGYTYPQKSSTTILNINAEDNNPDDRVYLTGTTSDGQSINHLVSTGYLWAELTTTDPEGLDDSRFNLDDKCFEDYASILVPKAIGYSAGLLNYFFRGEITMVSDLNNPSQYIIKNESSEYMSGTFSLNYYDINDNLHSITSWNLSINANSQSYPVTFTPPIYPEPKEKGKYTLVFQGTMGNETGAVVGRNLSLCEGDTPITISGPDKPVTGSQYTTTGGAPPYTWTISKGSITQDGVVTVSGQCGVVTITVTDACDNIATKQVMMPNGVWHLVSDTCYIPCNLWFGNTWWQPETCDRIGATCTIEDGTQKITYYFDAVGSGYNPSYPNCPTAACTLIGRGTSYGNTYQVKLTYEWRCP